MKKVGILSYGVGNVKSVARAFEKIGAKIVYITDKSEISFVDFLVLPGVGSFLNCKNRLIEKQLWSPINSYLEQDKPFLGICVGMQLLFEKSYEFGETNGFGLMAGDVCKLPKQDNLKIPMVGWKEVEFPLLSFSSTTEKFYFVHSFFGTPHNLNNQLAYYKYGQKKITAAVKKNNCIGTQFHPEKSGNAGLNFLSKVLEID